MRAPLEEYKAVEAAVMKRMAAVANGNSTEAKAAFSEEAVYFGYPNGQFDHEPIQSFFDNVDRVGSNPKFTFRVDVIALEETIAVARILEENWGGTSDFTDVLLMMKQGEEWKCVVQVYNQSSKTLSKSCTCDS